MIEVEILRLGAKGDGVAAGPVYAPFSLPGETARGAVEDGRIAAPEILSASPDRQAPPCPHFGACGGCALQHARDRFLADWKREMVAEALRAAGVTAGEIRRTVTSPPRSRRRAVFAARRTKKTVQVGFHGRASDQIVALERCEVAHPALVAILPAIAEAARLGGSRKAAIRATATLSEAGVDLAVEDAKPLDRAGLAAAAALAGAHDLARLAWNGEVVAQARAPVQRFGPALVAPAPGGFLQATREGEAALAAAAAEALGGARRIVDLFAGCGAFALRFADRAEIHAVEADAAALDALSAGWRAAGGLQRVTTEARDLFRRPLTAAELSRFDAAIIDPPRAGARAQAEALAAGGPPAIAALSCDPGTFARDARILADGGYRLDWVLPVDQFRWSPHVEIASRFSR